MKYLQNAATFLALVACAGGSALAGPIDPPAGPIGSTMKMLSEVEPRVLINATNTPGDDDSVFRITQPGSYYLGANTSVPTGKTGIEIATANVTIDLGGYTIFGVQGSFGIRAQTNPGSSTVRNGAIKGTTLGGIDLRWYPYDEQSQSRVENVSVSDVTDGIGIDINGGIIRNCQANTNQAGIFAIPFACVVENCTASENVEYGIYARTGTIKDSTLQYNGTGIYLYIGVIADNTIEVADAGQVGIDATGGVYVHNNVVSDESMTAGTIGIQILADGTAGARVRDNTITRVGTGIKVNTSNTLVVGNTFRGCTTAVTCVAGCRVGVLVTGTSSPALNGNSGGGLGTSDPYANIIY